MKGKSFIQFAWAIDTRSEEKHSFLGRSWQFPHEKPGQYQGGILRPRLFETRREARIALRAMKKEPYVSFPNAAAVRVKITVEEAQKEAQDAR